jgi:hypothetical protein
MTSRISRFFAALVAVAGLGLLGSTAEARAVPLPVWDLAADFRIAPEQANPNPDSLGHDRVWYFMQGATLDHQPSSYTPLASFFSDLFGVPGLEAWHGAVSDPGPNNFLPHVAFNAGTDSLPGLDWPHGAVLVHPLPDQTVIVGWRSPVTALVRVDGGVTDRNPGCGDGIDWSIDKGATTISNGDIPNGGGQPFSDGAAGARLSAVPVTAGQFLYFIVGPGPNHDYGCDSTQLDITITQP